MNKTIKIILFTLVILVGLFVFVYGGYDDSPGAQLLGVLIVAGGVIGIIKVNKKHRL
ncbi:MAG: hypothetical protein WC480_05240 [Patescibacteria group bacterium]